MTPLELFNKYESLVRAIITRKYGMVTDRAWELNDFIQIGYLALWNACHKYDQSLGEAKFKSYCVTRALGDISDFFRKAMQNRYTRKLAKDVQELGIKRVAEIERKTIEEIELKVHASKRVMVSIGEGSEGVIPELQVNNDLNDHSSEIELVLRWGTSFNEQDQCILKLLLQGNSRKEIAQQVGISEATVSCRKSIMIERLKIRAEEIA